jgi:hypothetical protein
MGQVYFEIEMTMQEMEIVRQRIADDQAEYARQERHLLSCAKKYYTEDKRRELLDGMRGGVPAPGLEDALLDLDQKWRNARYCADDVSLLQNIEETYCGRPNDNTTRFQRFIETINRGGK